MKERLKNNKQLKDLLMKFIYAAIIASVALLLLNVMTQSKDGRRQVVDNDGGTEYIPSAAVSSATEEELRLAEILGLIKGVGEVDVMITYHDTGQVSSVFSNIDETKSSNVKGVIVTAEGAGSPVIKSDIINAVSSVFDIQGSNVMVFERK